MLLIPLTFGSTVRAIDGVIDEPLSTTAAPSEADVNQSQPVNTENPSQNNLDNSASEPIMSQSIGANNVDGDTATTMAWPAIPGESLNDIARSFYPKSQTMRKQFVAETIALNADLEPKLKATNEFDEPTLLQIPTLKSLSQKVGVIQAKRAKAQRQKMHLSYSIKQTTSRIPAFLLQEYEALVSKNAFLKAELERLHIKLGVLQEKLNNLKLVLDKTLSFPASTASSTQVTPIDTSKNAVADSSVADVKPPETQTTTVLPPVKKVFKNLNPVPAAIVVAPAVVDQQAAPSLTIKPAFDWLKYGLLLILGGMILLSVIAYLIRKNRQRMLARLSEAMPSMEDDTVTHFGEQWQDTEQESEYVVEHQPSESKKAFLDTEMEKASSTLEEAKLLMSINRTQDAIAHLKLTIETQPKASINHWLYLLEVFRKINAKEEFEEYAKSLHQTFNVMTPVWYENDLATTNAAIVVSQHLEDFPHIMEKLDAVWPSELASVYLRSLITDNRDGERAGFSKSALDEILMLIALLDTRKDFESK